MNERQYGGDIARLRSPERLARLEVDRVVSLALDGLACQSMLDVGTGSGIFAEAFAGRGLRVSGVDVREDMLAAALTYVPGGDFRIGAMEKLPYEDKTFDLVFLGHVFHEADDPLRALTEALRVARVRAAVLEWPHRAEEIGPPLDHRVTPEFVLETARQAGFTNVERQTLSHMELYLLDV